MASAHRDFDKKKQWFILKGGVLVHFDGIVVDLINSIQKKNTDEKKIPKKNNVAN